MKKKTKRNLYRTSSNSDVEYTKIIKIAVGVIIVLALTYFITALATGEIKFNNKKKTEEAETSIQYEELIAGQVFNRADKDYYVLLFNFTDTYASYYLSIKDTYTKKDKSLPVYIVDLEKDINKDIVAEDSKNTKIYVDNINNLKVTNPTLIRIKDHKVVQSIEDRDKIIEFFEK
ncbi:MAG: hypothetical protein MRZ42_00475 [Tenericutes bacterium]|nr:hypothetical protein [Mycoplasmatota bacterium]